MAEEHQDIYGALVGWSCKDLGDKLVLKVQAMEPSENADNNEARSIFLLLTKNQASVLANYLTEVSGHVPPKRQPGMISRMLLRRR